MKARTPKITNEEFERRIATIGRNIKLVGNYVNSVTKVKMQCNECGHEWMAFPGNVLYLKTGCPACHYRKMHKAASKKLRMPKEEFVQKLKERFPSLQLIGRYYGSTTKPVTIMCNDCGYEHKVIPSSLLHQKYGCPHCSKQIGIAQRISNASKTFKERIANVNESIDVIGEYAGMKQEIRVRCKICGKEYDVIAENILKPTRCKHCLTKLSAASRQKEQNRLMRKESKQVNKNFQKKLKHNHIALRLIGDYTSARENTAFKCIRCGYEYYAIPNSVLNGTCTCRNCKGSTQGRYCKPRLLQDFNNIAKKCLLGETSGTFVLRNGTRISSSELQYYYNERMPNHLYAIGDYKYRDTGCICNELIQTEYDIVEFKQS